MTSARTRALVIPGGFALLLLLSAFTMALFFTACTEKSPVEPAGPSVEGTWQMISANGINMIGSEAWWTLEKGTANAWVGADDCHSTFTYTISGSKIITTVVEDGCADDPKGTKDTLAYTISGDQMTIRHDGQTIIFKKSVGGIPPSIQGIWDVTTVDGEGPPPGMSAKMQITFTNMLITQNNGGTSCQALFQYEKTGANTLKLVTLSSDCGEPEVGSVDTATWSISGNIMTLVYSDGTTLVAKRA